MENGNTRDSPQETSQHDGILRVRLYRTEPFRCHWNILTQTNVPTSVVLVSITGPYFLVTLLVPPFVHSIPLSTVVLVESCFFVISLLLVAVTQNLVSRLIGVSLSPVHVAWEIFLFSLGHLVMKRILSGHSRPALELGFGCLRCITWVCY